MIQTDDIFLGAYGLLRGGELVSVEVRCFGRRPVAVFTIGGQAATTAEREYHGGKAVVDLRLFKSEVRRLKDVAFGAIREIERVQRDKPAGAGVRDPVAWMANRRETDGLKPIDEATLGVVSESPGRNVSEREDGLEKVQHREPSPPNAGEGSRANRNLTDAASHPGGVLAAARWQGRAE